MRRAHLLLLPLTAAACLATAAPAVAQALPPVNLGATSFLDGGPPDGPGIYLNEYLQYYTADRFNDAAGHALPLPNPDLNVWTSLTQLILLPNYDLPLINAKPALDLLLPVVSTDVSFGAPGPFPRDNGAGLGDLLIGPALQFNPINGPDGQPLFVHRLEAQFIIPTGKFNADRQINPGSGFFSFDPYWAGTLFLGKKLEASYRLHYLWNAVSHHAEPEQGIESTQAGQAVHVNFAVSYEAIEKHLRVGINGYYLKQTTDSEINGARVPGREQVLGIGPGFIYSFNPQNHVFFNTYIETDVHNRPEGTRLTLRYVKKF
jgi:hypothetical protein